MRFRTSPVAVADVLLVLAVVRTGSLAPSRRTGRPDEVLREADAAMNVAKRQGGDRHHAHRAVYAETA